MIERPEPAALLALERDQDRRAVVALGDPRGDDADHARVPALARPARARGPAGCSATSASASKRIRVSTSRRSALTVSSSAATALRALAVLGQQQLEPGVGAVEPPGGVQPRAEPEADRGLVEPARVHARDVHQRAQADLARAGERPQALAHEPAVLALQRHDVGDRGQRDQVQVLVGQRRVLPRALQQRLRELVRDAGRAQVRARVAVDAAGARAARPAARRRRAASGGR